MAERSSRSLARGEDPPLEAAPAWPREGPAGDRFRALFDHSSDAHLIFDETGITDCNDAAVALIGCTSKDEVLSLHPAILSPERQPDGRLSLEKSKEMDQTARERGFHRFEWMHQKIDGTPVPVEVTINAIEVDGRPMMVVVWHDLTELKRREDELIRLTKELRTANERMHHELEAAAAIQASLLPREVPQIDGVLCSWAYRPCEELAGDILNVFALDADQVVFYVLDVSGHGVSASLLSVAASHFLSPAGDRALLCSLSSEDGRRQGVSPREIAERLNRQFQSRGRRLQYFTLFCGILNVRTLELRSVTAGHPAPLLLRKNGEMLSLEASGLPIGILPHARYEEMTTQLLPSDRLLVFSDGIPEARSPAGEFWGLERLCRHVRAGAGQSLETSIESILSAVTAFCSPNAPQDDISMVGIDVLGP